MNIRSSGLKIGKFFDIELHLAYSWLIIFTLITWSLIVGFLPMFYPEISLSLRVVAGLVISGLFFLSIVIHEFAHAIYAHRSGLEIHRITLFVFGGVAEIIDEPEDPKTELTMAILGPVASLSIAAVFGMLWYINTITLDNLVFTAISASLAGINTGVAIFNLLPGYPLDGGRIFRSIVWHFTDDVIKATRISSYGGRGLSMLMIAYGALLFLSGGVLDGTWIALLGWFLNRTARASYQHTLLRQGMKDVPIAKLINTKPLTATTDSKIADLHEVNPRQFNRQSILPVVENNTLKGYVNLSRLSSRGRTEHSAVSEMMTESSQQNVVTYNDSSASLLKKFRLTGIKELPVTKEGEFVGIINRDDLIRYVEARESFSHE